MSKRWQGGYAKTPNDFYPTPKSAVTPLAGFLRIGLKYYEPCAGAGDLIKHLKGYDRECVGACDIEPRDGFFGTIARRNCLDLVFRDVALADVMITNPPHTHKLLAPIIKHLRSLKPTWLLLPLDWFATKQASPHLDYCSHIKVIGRMKIYPDSPSTGFDNFAWGRFVANAVQTQFIGSDYTTRESRWDLP